jgi:serine/threonine protein kinase/Tol biopolymer transport system component
MTADGRKRARLTSDEWRRICIVLDRLHDVRPESRDAVLEDACREQGLATKDVRPFVDATERSKTLPEELPLDLIAGAFDVVAAETPVFQLDAGRTLGPYQIVASVGAGGMGEVYRANDTRLDRTVAIKVLRPHLLQSAGARQQFDREARAIARLNHPHVCTLYDVGHEDDVDFLVMEYVEGETLARRLERGAIPVSQAIRFGAQIADALDRAHRQGIVHRDLKPANIILTRGGVKLLDFGLAQLDVANASVDRAVIGTPQYMSPEQLERRPVDARTDIFAFGAVLYEMVTGKRAFTGSSQSSVVAAILECTPTPVSRMVAAAPAALEWTIVRCLAKDPEDRWQSAADVRHHLDWIAAVTEMPQTAARRIAPWISASVALAMVLLGIWAWRTRGVTSPPPAMSIFTIEPPAGTTFDLTHAISPDGRRIAFTTARSDGPRELWIRSLDSLVAQRISGSEDAAYPFWSPNGRFLAFFADRKLKKVELASGSVHIICDAGGGTAGGSWNQDDVIVFASASGTTTALSRVSALGGPATAITAPEEGRDAWPHFLSDGRRFIHMRAGRSEPGIYLRRLDASGNPTALMALSPGPRDATSGRTPPRLTKAVVAGDVLFFLDQTTLMAHRMDTRRMRPVGEAVRVAENVYSGPPGLAAFDASPGGVVTYRQPAPARTAQLTWLDRKGRTVGRFGDPGPHVMVSIAPDGRSVLVNQWDERGRPASGTVTRMDLDTGAPTPLFKNAAAPVWSPDGARVVFTQFLTGGVPTPTMAAIGGGTPVRPLADFGTQAHATDWSSDGRFIVGAAQHAATTWDIWIADAEGRELRYLREPFQQREAQISPDGRWVAYTATDARGVWDIYVRSFPDGGRVRRVSTRGGRSPRWRPDGRELYFVEPGARLMQVSIIGESELLLGAPELMFQHPGLSDAPEGSGFPYDVAPDGTRFLIGLPTSPAIPSTPIVVMLPWTFPAAR